MIGSREKRNENKQIVLIGVLKSKRDRDILFRERWYRIPVAYAPKRQFQYLAFYQPLSFGKEGKKIQYFAKVIDYKTIKQRKELLPREWSHPHAEHHYFQVKIGKIQKLPHTIHNVQAARRITFAFTTLDHLLKSQNILQLYNVPPIEEIVCGALKARGIKAFSQYYISINKKRFCLDFAIPCRDGRIAIECDNKKAHATSIQKRKDKIKDKFLKKGGWKIIRLREVDILNNLDKCIYKIQRAINNYGGQ